jgi:hypothetical protein
VAPVAPVAPAAAGSNAVLERLDRILAILEANRDAPPTIRDAKRA